MSNVPELMERNQRFASSTHKPLPMGSAMNTIVVSCLDARADPAHFLGLDPGEVLVIRNAGGRATDEVQQQVGVLSMMARKMLGPDARFEVVLVHHTDCGMERLASPEMRAGLSAATKVPLAELDGWAIADHSESLKFDLERLRSSAWVPAGITVTGARYDQQTGVLQRLFTEVL